MSTLPDISLPDHLTIQEAVPCADGEINQVYSCLVRERGAEVRAFLKINKHANLSLKNERDVLHRLDGGEIRVPRVMAFVDGPQEALLTETLPGRTLWDFLDPRRLGFAPRDVLKLLEEYGEALARIHELKLGWPPQVRGGLYEVHSAVIPEDERSRALAAWVESNALYHSRSFESVFVHGDPNIGNMLVEAGKICGVVDWEFAGMGWREYDLAWMLRERMTFLNTDEERQAMLRGYRRRADFQPEALQLSEVLNYLRFAKWASNEDARDFFLSRAGVAAMVLQVA